MCRLSLIDRSCSQTGGPSVLLKPGIGAPQEAHDRAELKPKCIPKFEYED